MKVDRVNINEIVSSEELGLPKRVDVAFEWTSALLERFHTNDELKKILILKKGLVQEIVDELLPLSIYSGEEYAGSDFFLKFYPGSTNSFDGEVIDKEGKLIERLEVTMAVDGYQRALQGESLLQLGHSPIYHTPEYSGKYQEREILESQPELICSSEIIRRHSSQILEVYEKKSRNISKYPDTNLLIAIDLGLLLDFECDQIINAAKIENSSFPRVSLVDITSKRVWRLYEK